MPIHHSVWRVAKSPSRLPETTLPGEQSLEDMIVASPEILSDHWMIIGRQEDTGFGGRIDLLAIAPDGALILIDPRQHARPWRPVYRRHMRVRLGGHCRCFALIGID